MSADNWAVCPQCYKAAIRKKNEATEIVNHGYGEVSQEQYLEAMEIASKPIIPESSLREDYELGMIAGDSEFYINYRCHCSRCDFRFEYKYYQVVVK